MSGLNMAPAKEAPLLECRKRLSNRHLGPLTDNTRRLAAEDTIALLYSCDKRVTDGNYINTDSLRRAY